MKKLLPFVLALAAAAQTKSALDKKTLEAYVRHLNLYPAGVTIVVSDPKPSEMPGLLEVNIVASMGQASEGRTYLVSKDGSRFLEGRVYDIGQNPFKKELEGLKTDFRPSMGTPGAPVVVVVFSDFQCQYCQKEAESLRKDLLKAFPTQVRVYFMDFPLTQIHPWAMNAALAGRCVFNQNALAFWDYHDWIFSKQAEITEQNFTQKRDEYLKSKGMDPAAIDRCAASPAAMKAVQASMDQARKLGVQSTPTLFVNGRKLGGYVPFDNLKAIIEMEVGYQATSKNAGEACCTLPAPGLLQPAANPILPAITPNK